MTEQIIVSTEWLDAHLADQNLRVIDIRGKVLPASEPMPHYHSHRRQYDECHIPGALFVDWTFDIVEPGSHSLDVANPQRYAALMSKLGIDSDTFVVAYDDADGMFAARMWWTLRYYGHQQVVVLDGGWQKWLAEGRPVTEEVPTVSPTTFVPVIQNEWLTNADEIVANQPVLVDVRTVDEFQGKASRAKRHGHIPNAINLPRSVLVNSDGSLKSKENLQQIFQENHISFDQTNIVVYCNSGVSSSYGMLALKVAGWQSCKLYDGSWKDWGNDDRRPIE